MTANDQRTIGLDRPVRLEWLDAVAGRLASGDSPKAARQYAWSLLEGVVAGETAQTARGKTLTVLGRVWLTPPAPAASLRDSALIRIAQASAEERLAIHWAMLCATYPFFVDVSSLIGKSLGLHGEVALSQLMRRLVDVWGDRSTLRPAAQRLIRSMVHWGVLRDSDKVGFFRAPSQMVAISPVISELLLEGLLVGMQRGMSLGQLVSHPALFPFNVRTDVTALRRNERLRVHRQGDQTDYVEREERPPHSKEPTKNTVPGRADKKSPTTAPGRKRRSGAQQLPLLSKLPRGAD